VMVKRNRQRAAERRKQKIVNDETFVPVPIVDSEKQTDHEVQKNTDGSDLVKQLGVELAEMKKTQPNEETQVKANSALKVEGAEISAKVKEIEAAEVKAKVAELEAQIPLKLNKDGKDVEWKMPQEFALQKEAQRKGELLSVAMQEYTEQKQMDKFMEPKGKEDEALMGRFETKIGSMRNAIFENAKGLDYTTQALIENSLGSALFDRSKRHADFEAAFLKKSNFPTIMDNLKKQINAEFQGEDVPKKEEKDMDAVTRAITEKLANQIAPKQQPQIRKQGGMGF
jgi:hypothetical protein